VDLLASLSAIAGGHGVGRIMRRNRPAGIRSRTVYEVPAAVVLHQAHREVQKLVMAKDLERFSRTVAHQYASLIRDGSWFGPMRKALDAFVASVQEQVTGAVRLRLFKGDVHVAGRRSPHAAFAPTLSAEETRGAFGGSVVVGFPGTRPAPVSAAKARAR
jgi:argininosuccinate synthase